MSCQMCDILSCSEEPSKCSACQAIKSASVESHNSVVTSKKQEVPAWAILAGLEDDYKNSEESELKSASVEEQEKPYWLIFFE